MTDRSERAVAIVGLGAIMPDAAGAVAFRDNIWSKKYSIIEVPPERWSAEDYWDPDPLAPAKTYSKIGAWVRGFQFDWQRWRIPPRVAGAMDEGQQWGVTIAAEALADYGWPNRPLDTDRTGVILGNAMAGERHYYTTLRIEFPEYRKLLLETKEFRELPQDVQQAILARFYAVTNERMPQITEDTMPGELANILAGRIANVLNLRGPSFTADAACASTFAALDAAVSLLLAGHCDAVVTGGIDRNMATNSFVKFAKIGALSASGSRPFGAGADGFVMGEGSAAFLLKRLVDAERDGDRIYAVIRGIGAASDGKGKGITAPNPIGQQLATERAWNDAGLDPATATLLEAHGTSTKVGDVVEVESLAPVFKGAAKGQIALGSAKSNIGHLKAAAGAAGLLKATWAVHEKVLPPTLNAEPPNPGIDFASTPFQLNHELREWKVSNGTPRRCGVSAYGFGGTNFHVVLEEHVPGALTRGSRPTQVAVPASFGSGSGLAAEVGSPARQPVRGLVVLGAASVDGLRQKVDELLARVKTGEVPPVAAPDPADLAAQERIAIDYEDGVELVERLQKAQKGLLKDTPHAWRAFQALGVFRGSGRAAGKIAFLFTGQGSQYVNMGRDLAAIEPVVADVFAEADRVLEPILGRKLTSYIFVDRKDSDAVKQAEEDLKQTAITQPAVLSMDTAMCRLLAQYGIEPDMVMGHSLGEYGALVSARVLSFAEALEAAAARGREMSKVSFGDNGAMAAVMAPLDLVLEELKQIDGYVTPANLNARGQVVIGGETPAVERAVELFSKKGFQAQRLPVSHAFHTRIVAAAAEPLRKVLDRFDIRPPQRLLVGNVEADFYPSDPEKIKDILCRQIASPVRWVEGVERLYAAGARAFVEVGPKRALKGFVDDVLADKTDVISLYTNRARPKELAAFNAALAGLYAAGYGARAFESASVRTPSVGRVAVAAPVVRREAYAPATSPAPTPTAGTLEELRALLQQTLESLPAEGASSQAGPFDRNDIPQGSIVISGTGLGLPGSKKSVMDPRNAERILAGEQFIDSLPQSTRRAMVDRRITRLVKSADGSGHFEVIEDEKDVIKLAGRAGSFDLTAEYAVPEKLVEALDSTTQLAFAAGLDALREAGIPLVQVYRKTSTGKYLPERWMLPEGLRDETGVIFASAFPGYDRWADETKRYYTFESRRAQKRQLQDVLAVTHEATAKREIELRIAELDALLEKEPYTFDRRFLLRILTMGHSQFAEYIGARGPNTHVNAACASTASAIGLAEDWIRVGRCRRVLVISADNATSESLFEWLASGFLAIGAAATDERVEDAALPFDRRRHGMLVGMGACALVLESQDCVRERGMRGIVELLATESRNSAFHATRLDVDHISDVVESLVSSAERRYGLDRARIANKTVFVSHETYTPARGGSAAAEVQSLRRVFGPGANEIVVSNTKGFTGHAMGVGVEDVIAVKILEHGIVPPVPNFKEPDPELGSLTLSKGGRYDVEYAIHLAAGFGSEIALTLTRKIPGGLDRVDDRASYERWLAEASGYPQVETEVVKRVLRVVAQGAPGRPASSPWRFGLGPVQRVVFPGDRVRAAVRPPAPRPVAPAAARVPIASAAPVAAAATSPAATAAPAVGALPVPAAAPAIVASAAPARDAVVERVLAIVAEKTGYPPDMLDLELDLEADLGVDTVKQAETFAAVREAYDIPRQENLKLRDFPTLRHVAQFVYDNRPELKPAAPAAAVPAAGMPPVATSVASPVLSGPTAAGATDPVAQKVLAIVSEKTGYPADMLELDLDLEADLGVDTVKQAETFAAVREAYDIPRQENLKLRDFPTLRHVMQFVYDSRSDLKPVTSATVAVSAAVSTAPSGPADAVVQNVLAIVAEKTGYPQDMLELDLDLEADLGVDTVKQAETFAAVREAYDIARQENVQLRDFPTLRHVVGFVYQFRPELKPAERPGAAAALLAAASAPAAVPAVAIASASSAAVTSAAPAPSGAAGVADPVVEKVLAIVAEKTGYPQDMLELDLDLEADLGVDTVKQAETFAAVREAYDIARQESLQLRDFPTLRHVVGFVYQFRPELKPAQPAAPASVPAAPPAAAAASVVPTAPPASNAPAASDPVVEKVLAIVADKTGYPSDMLELDLDLEADLGVDTVKQAETFAAVREAYDIARQESLQLRDFPTLRHVVGFVYQFRPDLKPVGAPAAVSTVRAPAAAASAAPAAAQPQRIQARLEDADRMPRRVPVPSLRPELDLCQPTGVSLASGSRVVVAADEGGVAEALTASLERRGVSVLRLVPGTPTGDVTTQTAAWLSAGPVQGVYWLPALDVEPPLAELDLAGFREANRRRVKNLHAAMRALYESVAGAGNFLISATCMGGLHGQTPEGATAPLGGAVAGFTKAYKRERGDVLVKVVDFAPGVPAAEVAEALVAETLGDPGIVEVGRHDGLRWTITLEEQPAKDGRPGLQLSKDTVFVVTGAAGGITSAIVADLAGASGGTFYLLDLVAAPDRDDRHVALLRQDREKLKAALIEEARTRGEKPTPVVIDKQIMATERAEAALRAVESVEAVGGKALWRSANLLDGAAVRAIVDEIRKTHGRIDVLVHAGGIEISRKLSDKEAKEFDLVFDIKADGFFSLLRAAEGMPLGATVVFSSIAGRFGNAGQTDYSSANALLCSMSRALHRTRPDTRTIAIDWTAWGGIGMATRGSIPQIMAAAGITMLPPESGIPTVRRELVAGGGSGEVVVAGTLGIMTAEFAANGGVDPAKVAAALAARERPLLMVGEVKAARLYGGLDVTTTLDPKLQPFLSDHQIDGVPVLPGVMGTEAFAAVASVIAPGFELAAIEDETFMAPFKFHRQQPATLHLSAAAQPAGIGELLVSVELRSRIQPKPELPAQERVHFKARVRMRREAGEKPKVAFKKPAAKALTIGKQPIYGVYFHGPAYQVIEKAGVEDGSVVALMANDLGPNGSPAEAATVTAPRLLELLFQAAGLWLLVRKETMALPTSLARAVFHRPPEEAKEKRLYALVEVREDGAAFDGKVVDEKGLVYAEVFAYRTVALPERRSLQA